MNNNPPELYQSPRYRMLENSHILLWLIKDTFWALEFKVGGIIMIFPTVFMAFYLLYKSHTSKAELFHNIAVCLWIMANSLWMLGEFFGHDLRHYAAIFFGIGLAVLAVYYLFYFKKNTTYK